MSLNYQETLDVLSTIGIESSIIELTRVNLLTVLLNYKYGSVSNLAINLVEIKEFGSDFEVHFEIQNNFIKLFRMILLIPNANFLEEATKVNNIISNNQFINLVNTTDSALFPTSVLPPNILIM